MKHIRALILMLAALAAAGVAAHGEAVYGPGLTRAEAGRGYAQARQLAERYGVDLAGDYPLYAPASPQPLNAYMVTHPDCQVGIDGDDMYPVSQRGLIPEITGYLDEWIGEIEAASGGAIRFVADPDGADVLVVAKQSYEVYGQYSGEGQSATGYSCVVELAAVQLSNPENRCVLTEKRKPEDTVGLRGGGTFWKTPPDLEGTEKLDAFANSVMQWYGLGARNGSRGAEVKAVQQALIDRGFLDGLADGDFGPKTEAALELLQGEYGLEPTGVVDAGTLLALYYDRDAAGALP